MPHIIVEYSKEMEKMVAVKPLLADIHAILVEGGIGAERINVRAKPYDQTFVGVQGADGLMLHATVLFLDTGEDGIKKGLAEKIHEYLVRKVREPYPAAPVSVEMRYMDGAKYFVER